MENLEEVLQALDEFQKMRPTEIPRELEDYLCWVAKTGDPVYQWSLIKTLFREKLTRVMTDFYESCPTLELAPCPNVEHFNYDTMKSNLLERLESFANAPFTVQRICELLTAPRKEYNRVDKFMRAIEKNILVVSTREPGPIARRSENGDGMVNGSIEEEASVTQPPQDVEMEYWEKDCASTVTISVHTVENESPLLHTVIPTATVVKNVFGPEEVPQEKLESTSSKSEMAASNFIPTTSEFTGVSNLPSQTQPQEPTIPQAMQNIPATTPEGSGIVGDVPEAIMNEDTSSQPSLDLENEEGEGAESTRKLQTTFQAKDFASGDKSSKFYPENAKPSEKAEGEALPANAEEPATDTEKSIEPPVKSNSEVATAVAAVEDKEAANPVAEDLLKVSDEKVEEKTKSDSEPENERTDTEPTEISTDVKEPQANETTNGEISPPTNDLKSESFTPYRTEKNELPSSRDCSSPLILTTGDAAHRIPTAEMDAEGSTVASASRVSTVDVEKDQTEDMELMDDTKAIVEEPFPKDDAKTNSDHEQEKESLTITEATEEEARTTKSAVPDPIPIIEEPRESESTSDGVNDTPNAVELSEDTANSISSAENQEESKEKPMVMENSNATELQDSTASTMAKTKEDDSLPAENSGKRERDQVELMDVDEDEPLSMFRQDEPMEQETVELSKS